MTFYSDISPKQKTADSLTSHRLRPIMPRPEPIS